MSRAKVIACFCLRCLRTTKERVVVDPNFVTNSYLN